jgi:Mg-chelatase subunit ChlD
VIKKPEP